MHRLKNLNHESAEILILAVILIAFIAVLSILNPGFLTFNTWESISFQFPELGVLTIGMAVTMLVGGINLSCIASANLSAIIMVTIMAALIPEGQDSKTAVFIAVAAGVLASVVIGILNGVIIAFFEVPDILATLSTQLLIGGLNLVITRGDIFSVSSQTFKQFGNGTLLGIPIPLLIFVVCVVIAAIVLNKTIQGKNMYIFGSNWTVSRFNGVNRSRLIIKTYALSGFFVGIAAIIMTSRFNSASAEYASSYLLQTVLIAVLAGVNPDGGKGKTIGLVIAILLIQVISSGFNIMRIDTHLSTAIWGIILLVSVFINRKNK